MKQSLAISFFSMVLALGSFSAYADYHEGAHHETEHYEMDADANKDGKISFEEFKVAREKHMEEHFKRRDTNQDGFIDEAERKAAREKWKAHHGKKDRCEMHK